VGSDKSGNVPVEPADLAEAIAADIDADGWLDWDGDGPTGMETEGTADESSGQ
jgi:hypothetical protein